MNTIARAVVVASALATIGLGTAASAQSVITFENLATGTTLSNQYAGQGVTFVANAFTGAGSSSSGEAWATNTNMTIVSSTGSDVGGLGTPSLVSGNILHAYSGWLSENGDPSFFINFAAPISSFSADFAGVAIPADTRIFVYNGSSLLATVAGTVTTGQFTLSYAAPSITRVAVAAGSYDDWVGVDNIRYTLAASSPVPEPASWAMMIAGVGAVGFAMRRRAKVRTTVRYA